MFRGCPIFWLFVGCRLVVTVWLGWCFRFGFADCLLIYGALQFHFLDKSLLTSVFAMLWLWDEFEFGFVGWYCYVRWVAA